jgi:curved DNA-binding protein CbpA
MVKLDYNRDYYGDLELPVTADENEVKKQFRKLGTLAHSQEQPVKS